MAKKPIALTQPNFQFDEEGYYGEEKSYDTADGTFRGLKYPSGKYAVAWKAPEGSDDLGDYGPQWTFENDGFDNPQDVYDFMDWQWGNTPTKDLEQLEKFDKFMDLEQITDQEKQNILSIYNTAVNYPEELQDELGSMSGELLNNPIVQQIIKKYSRKK